MRPFVIIALELVHIDCILFESTHESFNKRRDALSEFLQCAFSLVNLMLEQQSLVFTDAFVDGILFFAAVGGVVLFELIYVAVECFT